MHFSGAISSLLLTVLATLSSHVEAKPLSRRNTTALAPIRLIHEFPLGSWVENMAVRANGQLLVTMLTVPDLYLIDPTTNDMALVASFPEVIGLAAIAEVQPDVFAVTGCNFTTGLGTPDTTIHSPIANTTIAWTVDLRDVSLISSGNSSSLSQAPWVSKIAALPTVEFPNGIGRLSEADSTILVGDIKTGFVYRLNTITGEHAVVVDTDYTAAVPRDVLGITGVNGVHVRDNVLYFVNTGEGVFAKMPIHEDGTPAGDTTVIARTPEGAFYDEFFLRGDFAYVTLGSANSIAKIWLDGSGQQTIIAGNLNSTSLAGPTAVMFGRTAEDEDVMYVGTSGGLAVPVTQNGQQLQVGAQVVAINLSGF